MPSYLHCSAYIPYIPILALSTSHPPLSLSAHSLLSHPLVSLSHPTPSSNPLLFYTQLQASHLTRCRSVATPFPQLPPRCHPAATPLPPRCHPAAILLTPRCHPVAIAATYYSPVHGPHRHGHQRDQHVS